MNHFELYIIFNVKSNEFYYFYRAISKLNKLNFVLLLLESSILMAGF